MLARDSESHRRRRLGSDACPITRYAQAPQLRRSNVEAHWPMHRVGPRLSGLVDLLHVGGRRRMNGLTQVM